MTRVVRWFSPKGQRFPGRLRPPSRAAVAWRWKLEKTLHDEVAIGLAALALRLGRLAEPPDGDDEELRAARMLLRRILDDVRRIALGVYPPVLTAPDLEPALRSVAEPRGLLLSLDLPRHGLGWEVRCRAGLLVVDHLQSLPPGTFVAVRVRGRRLVRVRIIEGRNGRGTRREHWAVLRCG